MKIKYVHASAPREERVYDTEKSLRNCIGFIHGLGGNMTQEMWDQNELLWFESDRMQGTILSYRV